MNEANVIWRMGSFISHVEMAEGGGFSNVHITTSALFSEMVHKGEVGQNVQKSVHMVYK